jgi:hypothetical protein
MNKKVNHIKTNATGKQALETKEADTSFLDFINKYAGSIKRKKPINYKKDVEDFLRKKYGV